MDYRCGRRSDGAVEERCFAPLYPSPHSGDAGCALGTRIYRGECDSHLSGDYTCQCGRRYWVWDDGSQADITCLGPSGYLEWNQVFVGEGYTSWKNRQRWSERSRGLGNYARGGSQDVDLVVRRSSFCSAGLQASSLDSQPQASRESSWDLGDGKPLC